MGTGQALAYFGAKWLRMVYDMSISACLAMRPTHVAILHAVPTMIPLLLIRIPLGIRIPAPWMEFVKLQLARRAPAPRLNVENHGTRHTLNIETGHGVTVASTIPSTVYE